MVYKIIAFTLIILIPFLSHANEGQKIIGGFIAMLGQVGFVFFTIIGFIIHRAIKSPKVKISLLAFIVTGVAGLILYLMNDIDYPELLSGLLIVIFPFIFLLINISKYLINKN